MEEQSLRENQPRVKFALKYKGTFEDFFKIYPDGRKPYVDLCLKLRDNLSDMEYYGVTPIAPDGKIGGNGGAVLKTGEKEVLILSKSGKAAYHVMDIYQDFVIVESFDVSLWSCDYYASSAEVKPTSDAPLYHTALIQSRSLCGDSTPTYMLHGHAFASAENARDMNIPISLKATHFSTPEDSKALLDLMREFPFPNTKIYIRKDHGFVLLGQSYRDAWDCFEKSLVPYLQGGSFPKLVACVIVQYLPLLLWTSYYNK